VTTSRTRAVTLLSVAFLLGVGAGVLYLELGGRPDGARMAQGGRGPSWMRELDLDATQMDSVRAIYSRGECAMDSIRVRLKPPMDSLFELIRPEVEARRTAMRDEVRALLSPTQQERYDSMVQQSDSMRRRMREQPWGGCRRGQR
jgi:hypothetical protein